MSDQDLRELQALLVDAALSPRPLAGVGRTLDFPDLAAIRESTDRRISTENLEQPTLLGDAIKLIEPDEIRAYAQEAGPFPYLRFLPAEIDGGRIGLSLQLLTGFDDVEPLALGAVMAHFERGPDGNWIAIEPSAALAY